MLSSVIVLAVAASTVLAQTNEVHLVPADGSVSFHSIFYPKNYADNLYHIFHLIGSTDAGLEIVAQDYALEGKDSLVFTETNPDTGMLVAIEGFGAGARPTAPIRSRTNTVQVVFMTDASGSLKGFNFTVKSIKLAPATTVQPITSTSVHPVTSTSVPVECGSTSSLHADCKKGKLTFSDSDFQNTDELNLIFTVDTTRACRDLLYDAHTYVVSEAWKNSRRRSVPHPIAVSCSRGVLAVSDDQPETSEANELTFTTSGNLKCRQLFMNFLDFLANL